MFIASFYKMAADGSRNKDISNLSTWDGVTIHLYCSSPVLLGKVFNDICLPLPLGDTADRIQNIHAHSQIQMYSCYFKLSRFLNQKLTSSPEQELKF